VHHKALLDLITNLTDEGIVAPESIFLLGFSQSCALNYRFAFANAITLHGVIGICGGIPGDWETNETYKPATASVFHLAGTRDEFYPPSRVSDYAERLQTRAANVAFKTYDAGHEIIPAMREDIREWLLEHSPNH
jgi:phospholipase/carboxylesterase